MFAAASVPGFLKGDVSSRSYTESLDVFPNPERGWFVTIDPLQDTYDEDGIYVRGNTTMPHRPPPGFEAHALTPEKLREHRSNGISLIRKYYLLYDYRDSDIPERYLDEHPRYDFGLAREEGVKLIPRFIYTWNIEEFEPTDAPASRMLAHLDQLAPIIQENADVISHLEVGLVGHYGEWHYSGEGGDVYGHLSSSLSLDWPRPLGLGTVPATYPSGLSDSSKRLIDRVLEVLPQNRMATLRYIPHVRQMHDEVYGERLTADRAYSGGDLSRIGLQDDSFLYDASHRGGYYHPANDGGEIKRAERRFQRTTSRYVVMSGEPSGINPDQPGFFGDSDTVAELGEMHWNCMNNGQYDALREGIYDRWRSQGIYEEIGSRLGYRFVLREAGIPSRLSPNNTLSVTLDLENMGFAAPYNERPVWMILRNTRTNIAYSVRTDADARNWEAGERRRIVLRGRIPPDIQSGDYRVSLSLPDPAPRLGARPEYAIRLASDANGSSVWDPQTGYNDLKLSVQLGGEPIRSPDPGIPAFQRTAANPA